MKKSVCVSLLCAFVAFAVPPAWSQTSFDVPLAGQASPGGAPTLHVFLPDSAKATGRMVVACPGGGFSHLAMGHEGTEWADYFNGQGIALGVLEYRLPEGNPDVPVGDAIEALRTVRQRAAEWRVNPYDVGIMGSSAGGHLASTVALTAPFDLRPAFQILFYPVISMELGRTHAGSVHSFIGRDASADDQRKYSNQYNVRRHLTPPAILMLSADDRAVPVSNSLDYFRALSDAQVPAALHVYPSGGHGWGCKPSFAFHRQMLLDLSAWLGSLLAPAPDAVRVACVGNSITDGHGLGWSEVNGYPAVLGRLLGEGYVVRNFGVSAHTMLDKGDRPYMGHEAYRRCKEFNPDIVVIKLGTNDSKAHNWKHKADFKRDAQRMIDELKALPAKPEIYLVRPVKAMSGNFGISDSVIVNGVIPLLDELARENKLEVIDLHAVFDGHREWMLADGIHPNAQGAEVMAAEVKKAIAGRK